MAKHTLAALALLAAALAGARGSGEGQESLAVWPVGAPLVVAPARPSLPRPSLEL